MGERVLRADKSRSATKHCGYPVKVYWSRRFENWVICDGRTGALVFEFATGEPLRNDIIKQKFYHVRNRLQRETVKKNIEATRRKREKAEEDMKEYHRFVAGEIFNYGMGGKKHYSIGSKK